MGKCRRLCKRFLRWLRKKFFKKRRRCSKDKVNEPDLRNPPEVHAQNCPSTQRHNSQIKSKIFGDESKIEAKVQSLSENSLYCTEKDKKNVAFEIECSEPRPVSVLAAMHMRVVKRLSVKRERDDLQTRMDRAETNRKKLIHEQVIKCRKLSVKRAKNRCDDDLCEVKEDHSEHECMESGGSTCMFTEASSFGGKVYRDSGESYYETQTECLAVVENHFRRLDVSSWYPGNESGRFFRMPGCGPSYMEVSYELDTVGVNLKTLSDTHFSFMQVEQWYEPNTMIASFVYQRSLCHINTLCTYDGNGDQIPFFNLKALCEQIYAHGDNLERASVLRSLIQQISQYERDSLVRKEYYSMLLFGVQKLFSIEYSNQIAHTAGEVHEPFSGLAGEECGGFTSMPTGACSSGGGDRGVVDFHSSEDVCEENEGHWECNFENTDLSHGTEIVNRSDDSRCSESEVKECTEESASIGRNNIWKKLAGMMNSAEWMLGIYTNNNNKATEQSVKQTHSGGERSIFMRIFGKKQSSPRNPVRIIPPVCISPNTTAIEIQQTL